VSSTWCATAALVAVAACHATTIKGVVFVDANGDGVRQSDERGLGDVVVGFERDQLVRTRSDGSYTFESVLAAGFAWARVPDGFRPGAVSRWSNGTVAIDLPLVPETHTSDTISFVVAADSHVTADPTMQDPWDPVDLADAIDQAVDLEDAPRFFTIVGDITQGNRSEQFQRVVDALATTPVPWVAVPGNHDWYDGGATYRRVFGVDNYSFDIGNLHFLVWDTNLPDQEQIDFIDAELALVPEGMTVIAMGHNSPSDAVADAMEAAGVDYLFTGHWHVNRRLQRGSMVEWGTQTFVMGGIDQSPAGYRVVTFAGDVPIVTHRERLVESHLDLVEPHAGSCASPSGGPVIAAAALDGNTPDVTMRIDCGEPIHLTGVGGWDFRGDVPAWTTGTHSITLSATTPAGRSLERQVAIEVCAPSAAADAFTDWPQAGGGPRHEHASATPVTPPLGTRWTATIGGALSLGAPSIVGDLVVVAVMDFGAGDTGGLVALDLQTGAERWRYVTPFPAVSSPAIDAGLVVVTTKNGELHAVDLATGELRWRREVNPGAPSVKTSLWAPPTIADGLVYVATQGSFAAFELATGEPVWARDPSTPDDLAWLGSLAAVAVADGSAIAAFNRSLGLQSVSAATGSPEWSISDGRATAINASPVIADGVAYVINSAGVVSAIDVTTRSTRWSAIVTPSANDWDYAVTATPALADGRLFVATQRGDLIALDAATGAELWRARGASGPINYTHYRDASPGFPSSPVVTGDIVWIGTLAGELLAHDATDGHLLWSTQLGGPIASSPAPTGDALVVASYDGSVRLLAPAAPVPASPPPAACPPLPEPEPASVRDSDGCSTGGGGSLGAGIALLGLLVRRRRGATARFPSSARRARRWR
jgi:outer membrane protein assembly factor BamB